MILLLLILLILILLFDIIFVLNYFSIISFSKLYAFSQLNSKFDFWVKFSNSLYLFLLLFFIKLPFLYLCILSKHFYFFCSAFSSLFKSNSKIKQKKSKIKMEIKTIFMVWKIWRLFECDIEALLRLNDYRKSKIISFYFLFQ